MSYRFCPKTLSGIRTSLAINRIKLDASLSTRSAPVRRCPARLRCSFFYIYGAMTPAAPACCVWVEGDEASVIYLVADMTNE